MLGTGNAMDTTVLANPNHLLVILLVTGVAESMIIIALSIEYMTI